MNSLPPPDPEEPAVTQPSEGSPHNPLNPVIRRLLESKAVRLYGDRPIGDFWSPSDSRSPFEEALTVRQLCSLNLDPFIQKRSFTEKKQQALIAAIEECIASGQRVERFEEEGGGERVSARHLPEVNLPSSDQSNLSFHQGIWSLAEGVHPLVASTISSLLATADRQGSILSRIAYLIRTDVSVSGLEVLACCQYLTDVEAAKLLGCDKHHLKTVRESAMSAACEALRTDSILSLCVILLRGAALVSPELIVNQLRASIAIEPGAAQFAVAILCQSAGLLPISLPGIKRYLVTSNRATLEHFLGMVRAELPRNNQEIVSYVEGMFPLVSRDDCQALISTVGAFDEATDLWFPVSNEPVAHTRKCGSSLSAPRRKKK